MATELLEYVLRAKAEGLGEAAAVASALDAVDASAQKVKSELEKTREATERYKKMNQDASGALQTFGVDLSALDNPLTALAQGLKFVMDETMNYAGEVESLSRNLGISAAETSILIQAADDAKISTDVLTTATKELIKQGIQPTVANMGALADEYVAIQDPVAKSQFLLEKFGKAGLQMGKLLKQGSEGIRDAEKSARALGLVMDEQGIAKAEKFRVAMDELTDTFMGFVYQIGPPLLEGLGSAANGVLDLFKTYELLVIQLAATTGAMSWNEAGMRANALAAGDLFAVTRPLADIEKEITTTVGTATVALEKQATPLEALTTRSQALDEKYKAVKESAEKLAEQTKTATETVYAAAIKSVQDHNLELGKQLILDEKLRIASGLVKDEDEERVKAVDILTTRYANGLLTQQQYLDQVDKLASGAQSASEAIYGVRDSINSLQDKTVNVNYRVTEQYGAEPGGVGSASSGISGGTTTTDALYGNARAGGGPVNAGQPYVVGEQGMEPFIPQQNGFVMSNGDMQKMLGLLETIASVKNNVNVNVRGEGMSARVEHERRRADVRARMGGY